MAAGGFDGARLYAGADLEAAAERSVTGSLRPARRRPAPAAIDDLLNADWAQLVPRSCLVTGTERATGETMRILFRGRLQALEFAARHILGTDDFSRTPAGGGSDHDVLVVDHPLIGLGRARHAMHVPTWVGQRAALGATWLETLRALPAAARKEIGRLLRQQEYAVRVVPAGDEAETFYEALYLPYMQSRFGRSAVLGSPRAMARKARDGLLLELWRGADRLGANLLRVTSEAVRVEKMALALGFPPAGQSDLLDYFSLLLAQVLGRRFVDFGVSRPHLDDGVLRYKAKWLARLVPAGGVGKTLRICPLRASAATLGFLSRNGFIERRGDGRYAVRRLGEPSAEEAPKLRAFAARIGIELCVVPRDAFGAAGEPEPGAGLEPPPTDALEAFFASA